MIFCLTKNTQNCYLRDLIWFKRLLALNLLVRNRMFSLGTDRLLRPREGGGGGAVVS